MNANYRERLKDKKRIVIKIGSSSLIHSETGRLDFRKLEILARELSDLHTAFLRCRCRQQLSPPCQRKLYGFLPGELERHLH